VVVDRHVQVLPAGAAVAADVVTEGAFAYGPEAAELLRVHVQKLAGVLALVATGAAGRLCGARQARAAVPAQHLADRRGWVREQAGEPERSQAQRRRAARISCSRSGGSRRGCRFGVEGRSRSAAQPPVW
jgi:hypothetical protein